MLAYEFLMRGTENFFLFLLKKYVCCDTLQGDKLASKRAIPQSSACWQPIQASKKLKNLWAIKEKNSNKTSSTDVKLIYCKATVLKSDII